MQINGIAHIQLTVTNFEECSAFYRQLFHFFELSIVFDDPTVLYGVGRRTAIAINPCDPKFQRDVFEQRRVGLHHVCFRLYQREDIDALYAFLCSIHAKIVHPPEEGSWAKGYYSVLFEDPDGIRLEANFVPGKGNLDPNVMLPKQLPT